MKIRYVPTEKMKILGLDVRSLDNLAWCAATYGVSRLFWINGYLICAEIHDKSFEHEMEDREFIITHLCYASFPRYRKVLEVDKGTHVPVVNASDMGMFQELSKLIKEKDEEIDSDIQEEKKTVDLYDRKHNNRISI